MNINTMGRGGGREARKKGRLSHSIILLAAFLIIMLLSACSSGNPGKADSANTAGSDVTAKNNKEESDITTFESADGTVKIPKNPQRIVVIADSDVGYFLTLGVIPVGVTRTALENPYFAGNLNGVEAVGDLNQGSPEKVLALKPDLIIASPITADLEQIKKIAPTVLLDEGIPPKKLRDKLRDVGKITGREKLAETWIKQWDDKVSMAKTKVEKAIGDKTISVISPYSKGIYVWGGGLGRGGDVVYDELKLKAPPLVDTSEFFKSVSLEVVSDYAGDYIFTSPWTGDEGDPSIVYDSVVWKSLPAVKNNHVFRIDPKASYYNDPITLEGELDYIVDKLVQP